MESSALPTSTDAATGEAILDLAVSQAADVFGDRLDAAYALGSLAHGGFSSLVSDVDLGLILADPLIDDDGDLVQQIGARVQSTGAPLADRLSVFWGSRTSLMQGAALGRFPPLDRLDLIRYGRLLSGDDMRQGLPPPSHHQLVSAAARLCVSLVGRHPLVGWTKDPAAFLATGVRSYTKAVLFPVRFLYTARTGEIGRNHDAVAHMVTHDPGTAADLAAAALRWRTVPATLEDSRAITLIRNGLVPLYLACLEVHQALMRSGGEDGLAGELAGAQKQLLVTQR